MELRKCKQCGEHKVLTQFRKYYNRKSNSHYRTCVTCERINNRFKYLSGKAEPTVDEQDELNKLNKMYELLRSQGFAPPGSRKIDPLPDLDALLEEHQSRVDSMEEEMPDISTTDVPAELKQWLAEDLSSYDPEFLQDVVAESLLSKYRPQIGADGPTMTPVYDNTYREVLNTILRRFDDYEDSVE